MQWVNGLCYPNGRHVSFGLERLSVLRFAGFLTVEKRFLLSQREGHDATSLERQFVGIGSNAGQWGSEK